MPIPINKKMHVIINGVCVKAAEIAVPTNGAEHGVASKVAKKPVKKSA